MSRLTDFAENALIDFTRGQALTLPTDWTVHLLSAASDSAQTQLAGSGYAGVPVARSLAAWLSTQGNSLASTGTSHATANAAAIDFGTSGAAWGTWSHTGLYDGSGNCWAYAELPVPIVIGSGVPVAVAAGELAFTLGLTGGCSNYLSNRLIDLLFRAQAFSWPATTYHALMTAAPSNAGGGSEVAGGSYARVAVAASLAEWSGTHAPGSTDASSGTGGESSNNATVLWPAPTGNWGTLGWETEYDASTSGNLLFWAPLDQVITVSAGFNAPRALPGQLRRRFA